MGTSAKSSLRCPRGGFSWVCDCRSDLKILPVCTTTYGSLNKLPYVQFPTELHSVSEGVFVRRIFLPLLLLFLTSTANTQSTSQQRDNLAQYDLVIYGG